MSTENKIIGSVTVSAPFHREGKWYDADVVFDLHEDGQKSLRSQEVVRDGLYIDKLQDFQEEAYAQMHAWDTRELELTVEQLRRENAALRRDLDVARSTLPQLANLNAMGRRLRVPRKWLRDEAVEGRLPCVRAGAQFLFNISVVESALAARAALAPQEAARG